jgi:hypothetical protein
MKYLIYTDAIQDRTSLMDIEKRLVLVDTEIDAISIQIQLITEAESKMKIMPDQRTGYEHCFSMIIEVSAKLETNRDAYGWVQRAISIEREELESDAYVYDTLSNLRVFSCYSDGVTSIRAKESCLSQLSVGKGAYH